MAIPERVLVLITSLNRGGAETMAMNYYRNFDRSQIQYDFLVNRPEQGAYENEIASLGGKVFRMSPMYPQYFHKYKQEFRDFLREHPEYRIIHSNLEERSYFPLRIAAEEGVPVRIAHAHNVYRGIDGKMPFRHYFRTKLPKYITQGFACSHEAGNWLFGKERMNMGEVSIVHNAIDERLYRYSPQLRDEMRKSMDLVGKLVIGNVGRLTAQKNQEFVMKTFAQICSMRRDSVLLLIGEGELRKRLEQLAIELHIRKNVIFMGSVPNVQDYLQVMDIFIFPSLYEGLGTSIVEAQATGLPCIASNFVPKEADISPSIQHMSLRETPEKWAKRALELLELNQIREENCPVLSQYGLDIRVEAVRLQSFYLENLKTVLHEQQDERRNNA